MIFPRLIPVALGAACLCAGSCSRTASTVAATDAADDSVLCLVVGSYASPDEEGIAAYRFNANTGEAERIGALSGISNPSYLTLSPDGRSIYSVGEDAGNSSTANLISFDPSTGTMKLLDSVSVGGGAPCYISLSPDGRYVLTANYMGGSVTVVPLDSAGRLTRPVEIIGFEGTSVDPERQNQPHLHCVTFTPDGRFLLANDLGTDKIHLFPVATGADSLLDTAGMTDIDISPRSGPRHVEFHPDGRHAYLINEISGQVTMLEYDGATLTPRQYIASDTVGAEGSGDIHLSPDGRFLYSSNRLKADGIAIFSINPADGTLSRIGYQPTGIHPRNFTLTPDGRFLLVACRDSNLIQVFSRDPSTGLLSDTGLDIVTRRPVCLKFLTKNS